MAALFLVHDFSPSRVWLYSLLGASATLLAKNNIALAPFNSWACETVPTHYILWETWFANAPLPAHITFQFSEIAKSLEAGKNALLLSPALATAQHEFFRKNLEKFVDMTRHEARAIFIIGFPGQLLENYFREVPGAEPAHAPGMYEAIAGIPDLVENFRRRHGDGNCQIIANPCLSPGPAPRLARMMGALLGSRLRPPSSPPAHPLLFRSHAARRIAANLEVGENSWPALDGKHVGRALLKLDRSLPEDFLSPLEARQKFADGAIQAALEDMCAVPHGTLGGPELFYSSPACAADAPVDESALADFAAFLRKEDGKVLYARYHNDSHMLNAEQQALKDCLGHKYAGCPEFEKVEVVEPLPLLTVLTLAYNHGKYIRRCMDSVLAQQTNFPVLHLVLDHHSEDDTARIIAEYASRYPTIRPVLLSRRRWLENVRGLFGRCRSVYAAICDGDDYFTDTNKLQRQVDFLEKRPDFSLCFHPVAAVFEDGRPTAIFPPLRMLPDNGGDAYELSQLVERNFIQSNSAVYRWRFREGLPDWFRADLVPGDWYWHLLHAEVGKIGYIPRVMSVYRRHANALYEAGARSSVELRRGTGIEELAAYRAYNAHFGNRYQKSFARLANNVLEDFAALAREGEKTLLDYALGAYPEFFPAGRPSI